MPHRPFHHLVNADLAHAEDGGVQHVTHGRFPNLVDGADAMHHSKDGAHGRAVAIGVKTALNRQADGFCKIAFAV